MDWGQPCLLRPRLAHREKILSIGVEASVMAYLLSLMLFACIWDEDTVDDELRGVPEVQALITNRWFRHGLETYRERVARLSEKADLSMEDYDNLAVAYERLGNRALALEVLQRKWKDLKRSPDPEHYYRYHANKGTIHAHDGDFDSALVELRKAIKLNPDAHFGREKYQILAIEYIRAAKDEPEIWRDHNFLSYAGYDFREGQHWVSFRDKRSTGKVLNADEAREAVSGMIRFGGLEGAELYRTLGDILSLEGHHTLSWWLYRYALRKGHPAKEELEAAIVEIVMNWDGSGFRDFPGSEDFDEVYDNGQRWLSTLHKLEAGRIGQGEDTDIIELLARTNETVPSTGIVDSKPFKPKSQDPLLRVFLFTATCVFLFLFLSFRFVMRVRRIK